jgi:hypothetical protein
MAILKQTILTGDTVPADDLGVSVGGGLIVGVFLPTGANGVTYEPQYSPDEGANWYPVQDIDGATRDITFVAAGMHNIDPPMRAPYFRLESSAAEAADIEYEVHTV